MHLRRLISSHALVSLLSLAAVACDGARGGPATPFRGVVLSPPIDKPDLVLEDVDGKPFNLRLATAGKVTLLFFGYTHCPDVCPLHAANVAAVLRKLPFEERDQIRFVFVTTDPERDTAERLRTWLGAFDPSFIGLRGPIEQITGIQTGLRMAAPQREAAPSDTGGYLVSHSAQVLAFGKDGLARLEYPFGIRQEDWAHDLPRLARGETPTEATSDSAGEPRAAAPQPIETGPAVMPRPVSLAEAAVYLTLRNLPAGDTLIQAWSPAAGDVTVHESHRTGNVVHMTPLERVVVPPTGVLEFAPGKLHLMAVALGQQPVVGQSFPISLRFAKAGDLVFAALVVEYADVERLLAPAGR
jgi:cytochrome oxidase Cu insertion factor (SCO1/SenC/PrrC family)/copper(I)-binding protein